MAGVYHLWLFVSRREPSSVCFGLSCLFIAMRSLVVGQNFIYEIIPDIDWTLVNKLEYESYYLLVPLSVLFLRSLYPAEMPRIVARAVSAVGFAFALYALIAPAYLVSKTNFVYQIFNLAVILHAACVLLLAVWRRREGAVLILIGAMCVSGTAVWDTLYYNEWVRFGDISPVGLLAIPITQSFVLASRFSGAFAREEQLSRKLMEINRNLERTVEERTSDIRRMEASRQALLANISHDLNTPVMLIQGSVEALRSGIVKEEAGRMRYLEMMNKRMDGLVRLIRDLFELAKLEDRAIGMHFQPISVDEFVRHFSTQFGSEVSESGRRFETAQSGAAARAAGWELNADLDRIGQVLTNLVDNALAHTDADKGAIRFEFDCVRDRDSGELMVSVIDNGTGIREEDLPHVFERLYQSGGSGDGRRGRSGLGLAIAKEIILAHGGRIGAESKRHEGSRFWFTLPIAERRQG